MAKLIHSIKSEDFLGKYKNWASSKPGTGEGENEVFYSIAFTDDGYLYTHGKKFSMMPVNETGKAKPFDFIVVGKTVTLTVKDAESPTFDLPITSVSNTDKTLSIAKLETTNNYTIDHVHPLESNKSLGNYFGDISASNCTVTIPSFKVNKSGHVIEIANKTATNFNVVKLTLDNAISAKIHLLGTSETTTKNNATTKFSTKFFLNKYTENGATIYYLNAPEIKINDKKFSRYFVDTNGNPIYANATNAGMVKKLLDTYDSSDVTSGIVATPKAVKKAYDDAKALFSANDAMTFLGTVDLNGNITSSNPILTESKITNVSNLKNVLAGWTFRFNKVEKPTGTAIPAFANLENGDIIICTADYTSGWDSSKWTIVLNNIDGAITALAALKPGLVKVSKEGHVVESFEYNKTNIKQYLTCTNNVLKWESIKDANTWRPVEVGGVSVLDNVPSSSKNLKFIDGSFTEAIYDNGVKINVTGLLAFALTNGTKTYTYNPLYEGTEGDILESIKVGGGLVMSDTSKQATIAHRSPTAKVELGTLTAKKLKIDSYGHIIETADLSSLSIGTSSKKISYNASSNISITFSTGDDLTINPTLTTNSANYAISLTHKYKDIKWYNPLAPGNDKFLTVSGNTTTSFKIKAGSNVSLGVDSDGSLKINSSYVNTWRNVSAYVKNDSGIASSEILTKGGLGLADLSFGNEFIWTSSKKDDNAGELKLVWAEVEGNNITYAW